MSIFGIILLGLIEAGSIGFAYDPLAGGVSLRLGAEEGFRSHLILSFGSGENMVDSAKYIWHPGEYYRETVYEESFWRPYSWINLGIRAEYYFARKEWYQPYIGIGIGGKTESRWRNGYEWNDTIEVTTPVLTETDYFGPAAIVGIDFYPLSLISKLLNFKVPFAEAISFNIEICAFLLLKHKFKDTHSTRWSYYYYYPERKFSGIEAGAGIHFNW